MNTIRTNLQLITRSLPAPLLKVGLSLLGPDCYKSLVLDINLDDTTCLKLATSKALGLGIIAGSSVVKIPQILKLLNSQSAAGVSFLSYFLETAAFVITLAYSARSGYPFSTYGETALIAAQNVVICLLVLRYQGRTAAASVFLEGLVAAGWALQEEKVVDMGMLGWAQAGAGVLGVASKAPQIWTIWKEGGTGQLSAFAVFNYLVGSLSRIFTTIQEVDDKLILYGFIAGFILNVILAAQMVYYWNSPATASHAAEMGNEPEKMVNGSSTGALTSKPKGLTTRRRG
ncbi:MAG: hypothetical protein Q9217_003517 [Psora testacea]